jgi:hypothetical protein
LPPEISSGTNFNDPIGIRTHYSLACSIALQLSMLPRASILCMHFTYWIHQP